MTLAFTVYGVAESKGSMRAYTPKGMRFPVVTDSNRNVRSWQQLIAEGASKALMQLPAAERKLVTGGVHCEVAFFLPRPKDLHRPKYRGVEVAHTKAPDIDKLTRAVLDALTSVLWVDDAQVVELFAFKRYTAVGEPARVDVAVRPSLVALPMFGAVQAEA